jgi:hypothetical protein
MLALIEKKIRLHAEQLYQERECVRGCAVEDWLQAESAVLKSSILAPLWRQHRAASDASGPTSYDSGYEHSLEHWLDLQSLVQESDSLSGASGT